MLLQGMEAEGKILLQRRDCASEVTPRGPRVNIFIFTDLRVYGYAALLPPPFLEGLVHNRCAPRFGTPLRTDIGPIQLLFHRMEQ